MRSLYNELRARGLDFEDDIAPRDEYELTGFVLHDPDGNHIGIGGEEAPPNDGLQMAIEHVEIDVQEVETAKTFYGDLCGWTFQDYGERYSSFSHGAGHGDLNRAAPGSGGYVLPVLYAHDLEAALDRVRQCGARGSRPPFDIPGGAQIPVSGSQRQRNRNLVRRCVIRQSPGRRMPCPRSPPPSRTPVVATNRPAATGGLLLIIHIRAMIPKVGEAT